jgi:Leucine-rich repeat (LRR) protein
MSTIQNHRPLENWPEWDRYAMSVAEIPVDAQRALIYREKKSHRDLSSRNRLLKLKARQVNQEFLNEICELPNLVYLELDVVTATDLTPLKNLVSLESLRIESVRKAEDFTPLAAMNWLGYLSINHAKHLSELSQLSNAHHLRMLGVEGGMWGAQKIEGLQPLCGLQSLECLFMSSVVLRDKDLSCLAEIPNLRVFDCARFASKSQFEELRKLLPELECRWCDSYDVS